MNTRRLHIPSIRKLVGDATQADFNRLTSPFAERVITPEDLCMPTASNRPDLVRIEVGSPTCPSVRMTRRKVFSGRIREEGR